MDNKLHFHNFFFDEFYNSIVVHQVFNSISLEEKNINHNNLYTPIVNPLFFHKRRQIMSVFFYPLVTPELSILKNENIEPGHKFIARDYNYGSVWGATLAFIWKPILNITRIMPFSHQINLPVGMGSNILKNGAIQFFNKTYSEKEPTNSISENMTQLKYSRLVEYVRKYLEEYKDSNDVINRAWEVNQDSVKLNKENAPVSDFISILTTGGGQVLSKAMDYNKETGAKYTLSPEEEFLVQTFYLYPIMNNNPKYIKYDSPIGIFSSQGTYEFRSGTDLLSIPVENIVLGIRATSNWLTYTLHDHLQGFLDENTKNNYNITFESKLNQNNPDILDHTLNEFYVNIVNMFHNLIDQRNQDNILKTGLKLSQNIHYGLSNDIIKISSKFFNKEINHGSELDLTGLVTYDIKTGVENKLELSINMNDTMNIIQNNEVRKYLENDVLNSMSNLAFNRSTLRGLSTGFMNLRNTSDKLGTTPKYLGMGDGLDTSVISGEDAEEIRKQGKEVDAFVYQAHPFLEDYKLILKSSLPGSINLSLKNEVHLKFDSSKISPTVIIDSIKIKLALGINMSASLNFTNILDGTDITYIPSLSDSFLANFSEFKNFVDAKSFDKLMEEDIDSGANLLKNILNSMAIEITAVSTLDKDVHNLIDKLGGENKNQELKSFLERRVNVMYKYNSGIFDSHTAGHTDIDLTLSSINNSSKSEPSIIMVNVDKTSLNFKKFIADQSKKAIHTSISKLEEGVKNGFYIVGEPKFSSKLTQYDLELSIKSFLSNNSQPNQELQTKIFVKQNDSLNAVNCHSFIIPVEGIKVIEGAEPASELKKLFPIKKFNPSLDSTDLENKLETLTSAEVCRILCYETSTGISDAMSSQIFPESVPINIENVSGGTLEEKLIRLCESNQVAMSFDYFPNFSSMDKNIIPSKILSHISDNIRANIEVIESLTEDEIVNKKNNSGELNSWRIDHAKSILQREYTNANDQTEAKILFGKSHSLKTVEEVAKMVVFKSIQGQDPNLSGYVTLDEYVNWKETKLTSNMKQTINSIGAILENLVVFSSESSFTLLDKTVFSTPLTQKNLRKYGSDENPLKLQQIEFLKSLGSNLNKIDIRDVLCERLDNLIRSYKSDMSYKDAIINAVTRFLSTHTHLNSNEKDIDALTQFILLSLNSGKEIGSASPLEPFSIYPDSNGNVKLWMNKNYLKGLKIAGEQIKTGQPSSFTSMFEYIQDDKEGGHLVGQSPFGSITDQSGKKQYIMPYCIRNTWRTSLGRIIYKKPKQPIVETKNQDKQNKSMLLLDPKHGALNTWNKYMLSDKIKRDEIMGFALDIESFITSLYMKYSYHLTPTSKPSRELIIFNSTDDLNFITNNIFEIIDSKVSFGSDGQIVIKSPIIEYFYKKNQILQTQLQKLQTKAITTAVDKLSQDISTEEILEQDLCKYFTRNQTDIKNSLISIASIRNKESRDQAFLQAFEKIIKDFAIDHNKNNEEISCDKHLETLRKCNEALGNLTQPAEIKSLIDSIRHELQKQENTKDILPTRRDVFEDLTRTYSEAMNMVLSYIHSKETLKENVDLTSIRTSLGTVTDMNSDYCVVSFDESDEGYLLHKFVSLDNRTKSYSVSNDTRKSNIKLSSHREETDCLIQKTDVKKLEKDLSEFHIAEQADQMLKMYKAINSNPISLKTNIYFEFVYKFKAGININISSFNEIGIGNFIRGEWSKSKLKTSFTIGMGKKTKKIIIDMVSYHFNTLIEVTGISQYIG